MTLKPVGENLVLKIEENEEEVTTASGIVLPSSTKEDPDIAEVLAVGSEILEDDDKKDTVKVGDKVIYKKYAGTEVELEDEKFIIISYDDLLCVVE